MKKKVLASLLVASMMATMVAGCGSKKDAPADNNATTGDTQAADAAADDSASSEDAIANLIAATDGTVSLDLW